MYVDVLIYFSKDPQVEREFENRLSTYVKTDFMGKVTHFLGIKFQWQQTLTRTSVHLSQQAFAENLIKDAGLDNASSTITPTPFRSGFPVDSIISPRS